MCVCVYAGNFGRQPPIDDGREDESGDEANNKLVIEEEPPLEIDESWCPSDEDTVSTRCTRTTKKSPSLPFFFTLPWMKSTLKQFCICTFDLSIFYSSFTLEKSILKELTHI